MKKYYYIDLDHSSSSLNKKKRCRDFIPSISNEDNLDDLDLLIAKEGRTCFFFFGKSVYQDF